MLYSSSTNSSEALCKLVLPDCFASWRQGVATVGQVAQIGKFGHLGWPTSVGLCEDLVKTTPDPQALISPSVQCIRVLLAMTLACLLFPEGMVTRRGRKQQERQIWQRGTRRKLHNPG